MVALHALSRDEETGRGWRALLRSASSHARKRPTVPLARRATRIYPFANSCTLSLSLNHPARFLPGLHPRRWSGINVKVGNVGGDADYTFRISVYVYTCNIYVKSSRGTAAWWRGNDAAVTELRPLPKRGEYYRDIRGSVMITIRFYASHLTTDRRRSLVAALRERLRSSDLRAMWQKCNVAVEYRERYATMVTNDKNENFNRRAIPQNRCYSFTDLFISNFYL